MVKKKTKKKKKRNEKSNGENSKVKEYGVILKKEKKYRHRIYPQKGKVPDEDEDYKIV